MYQMDFYLNQVPEGALHLRVNLSATPIGPLFKASLYDADGDAIADPDYSAMTATLIVRRSDENATDEISIAEEADPMTTDNIFYFNLAQITFEPGNYEAHIELEATYESADATPIPATPLAEIMFFGAFNIEVLA
jgi:hypothetical protein